MSRCSSRWIRPLRIGLDRGGRLGTRRRGRGRRAPSRRAPRRGGRASRRGERPPPWPARPSRRRRRAWPGAGRIARCGDARCTGSGRAPGRGPRRRRRPGSRRAFAPPTRGASGRRPRAGTGRSCPRGRAQRRGRRHRSPGQAAPCRPRSSGHHRPLARRRRRGSPRPCGAARPGQGDRPIAERPAAHRRRTSCRGTRPANVSGRGRTARTMPCSSIATTIGTAGASSRLIGSWRIGQSNCFHWANSRQRSACCSWVTPSSARRPCFTHSRVDSCQTGTCWRQPTHHEANWISSTFLPRKFDKETGARSPIVGRVKSGCLCPTFGGIWRGPGTRTRGDHSPTGRNDEGQVPHGSSPHHSGARASFQSQSHHDKSSRRVPQAIPFVRRGALRGLRALHGSPWHPYGPGELGTGNSTPPGAASAFDDSDVAAVGVDRHGTSAAWCTTAVRLS